ncbi:uncharacterized protein PRCAT00004155001 [Priceomyces carsonii]|uniref:uncharacterized protein n=1 Tax=Priceomyces carsonii TaxID=28549 RepID=UPI002ED7FDB2|nr:unnamed protein product [Priceomyces carsonii]
MSILSSLFGSSKEEKHIDKSVDELFKKSASAVPKELLKRTRTILEEPEKQQHIFESKENIDSDDKDVKDLKNPIVADEQSHSRDKRRKKKSDVDENLEAKYFAKLLKNGDQEKEEEEKKEREVDSNEVEGSEKDEDKEVEKSTTKSKTATPASRIDLKEDELKKAERTVFVGNVVSLVATSKKITKKFKKLFTQFGKVESIRFRSISFDEVLPRKIAFAKKKLHDSRESLNAYVVFEEKESSLKAVSLNATMFEDCHIRVDHVGHPAPKDNRRTIFVGNLDFQEKEETLWKYFNSKTDNDVESVRVVRDSATNLGKGFALVQFKDTLSVNKALLLNDKPLSDSNKRKLRISRAKSHTQPSLLSPNHIDNIKKKFASNKSKFKAGRLTDQQKTKIGRASKILGKADRKSLGRQIIEGERAHKGTLIPGISKKYKKDRVKKPRIRERSTKFKQNKK